MKCKNCDWNMDVLANSPGSFVKLGFCTETCESAYPRRNEEIRRQALEEAAKWFEDTGWPNGAKDLRRLIEPNHTAGLKAGDELLPLAPVHEKIPSYRVTAVVDKDTIKVERVR